MTQDIEKHLKIIRGLQKKYPDLHVGGSIGLYLHGIKLSRDISKSDIDLCKAIDIAAPKNIITGQGSAPDFDYRFMYDGLKIEVRIDPEQEFDTVIHNGMSYRVTKLFIIIAFKKMYSKTGDRKHVDDLKDISNARSVV